jgi:hypothetical protein
VEHITRQLNNNYLVWNLEPENPDASLRSLHLNQSYPNLAEVFNRQVRLFPLQTYPSTCARARTHASLRARARIGLPVLHGA